MANSRIATSSILQGFPKSRSLLVGNPYYFPNDYESIATITIGAGGSTSITFSSIPSTYSHLQLRIATNGGGDRLQFNSDTGSNYARHYSLGNGSAASAGGSINQTYAAVGDYTTTASFFPGTIIDILDYSNTNKYKTVRSFTGFDNNTQGEAFQFGAHWRSNSAISSITITGGTMAQYSSFALYGIK